MNELREAADRAMEMESATVDPMVERGESVRELDRLAAYGVDPQEFTSYITATIKAAITVGHRDPVDFASFMFQRGLEMGYQLAELRRAKDPNPGS